MPLPGHRWIAVLAACSGCLAGALAAAPRPQAQQPRATFRSSIELVQIDAVVVDAQGRHVRGLTAEDFAVFDRGKRQAIAAFEEVIHRRAEDSASGPVLPVTVRTGIASNQTPQSSRLVVMVIDDLHIWRGRTETARTIARDVLSRLGRDASMAVLFTSGDHSTQVTDDPSRLLSAIETLDGRQTVQRPNQAVDTQSPRGIDPELPSEQALAIVQQTQSTSVRQFSDNMRLFTTLEDAARMLGAGNADRKAFVLISEGLAKNPTGIFGSMSETPQTPTGGAEYASTGDASATITAPPAGYHDVALVDMMDAMQRSNVTTYAIDPRGEVTSEELALESFPGPVGWGAEDPIFRWHHPVRMAQDGLATIAEASGGFAVVDSDDFTSGIDDILEDLDHYYLLGFYPADTKGDRFRPVHVAVPKRPGMTVRFRRGYVPRPEKKKSTEEVDPLVALSSGVLPSRDLPLRLAAIPFSAAGKDTNVALALEVTVPRIAVEEADRRLRDQLAYEVIVVDEGKNKVRSGGGMTGRVTLAPRQGAGGPLPDTVSYQVADTLTLRPGTYQLRVSARSAKLGAGGSVYLHVEVPDFSKPQVALSGIAIGYAAGPRVPAAIVSAGRPKSMRSAARMASGTPSSLLPFAPTLDRTFAATETLRVYFKVASRERMAGLDGAVTILGADGTTVHVSVPFAPDEDGRVDLRVPLGDLARGAYILRASVTGSEHTATREIGFVISPGQED
jgi:VWFA-related protein